MCRRSERAGAASAAPAPPSYLYAEYLADEVRAERERRTSLEQRGLGVISAGGLFIGFLFAAGRGGELSRLPDISAWLLLAALTCLLPAVLCGLLCALPRSYGGIDDEYLRELLLENWDELDDLASRRIGGIRTGVVLISRRLNNVKAIMLRIAVASAAAGVLTASASLVAAVVASR